MSDPYTESRVVSALSGILGYVTPVQRRVLQALDEDARNYIRVVRFVRSGQREPRSITLVTRASRGPIQLRSMLLSSLQNRGYIAPTGHVDWMRDERIDVKITSKGQCRVRGTSAGWAK